MGAIEVRWLRSGPVAGHVVAALVHGVREVLDGPSHFLQIAPADLADALEERKLSAHTFNLCPQARRQSLRGVPGAFRIGQPLQQGTVLVLQAGQLPLTRLAGGVLFVDHLHQAVQLPLDVLQPPLPCRPVGRPRRLALPQSVDRRPQLVACVMQQPVLGLQRGRLAAGGVAAALGIAGGAAGALALGRRVLELLAQSRVLSHQHCPALLLRRAFAAIARELSLHLLDLRVLLARQTHVVLQVAYKALQAGDLAIFVVHLRLNRACGLCHCLRAVQIMICACAVLLACATQREQVGIHGQQLVLQLRCP
eukprot:m.264837 g.264837  ORF g.264837 m.264837 type:complete len:309 (-) comp28640_c0_seq1:464-1390(-)